MIESCDVHLDHAREKEWRTQEETYQYDIFGFCKFCHKQIYLCDHNRCLPIQIKGNGDDHERTKA